MAEFSFSPQKPRSLREVDLQSKDGGSFPAATPVDVPTGWDPRANQSPTGALVTVLCTAALFDSRTGQIKNALARMRKGVFMTRTGIEPMLQP